MIGFGIIESAWIIGGILSIFKVSASTCGINCSVVSATCAVAKADKKIKKQISRGLDN